MRPKTHRLKIEVTAEDIQNGIRADSARCPIALALKRLVGDEPRVAMWVHYRDEEGGYWEGKATERIKTWYSAFDNREPVEPDYFYLVVTKLSSGCQWTS